MFGFGSKGYKYHNTRQYLRLPAVWPIKCRMSERPEEPRVMETTDVSAGGISVMVPEPLTVGHSIHLEVHAAPLGRVIEVDGVILRCRPTGREGYELGVRFTRIDPKDQQDLNKALEKFYSPGQRARQQGGSWWRKVH